MGIASVMVIGVLWVRYRYINLRGWVVNVERYVERYIYIFGERRVMWEAFWNDKREDSL